MIRSKQRSSRIESLQNSIALIKASLRGEEHDYTKGPVNRAIVLLAIPMVLEMVMESIFAVVDIFFVAQLGAAAVAAVGITEALITVIYAVAVGLSVATTAMIARRIGENDKDRAAVAAGQALWLGLLVAGIVGFCGIAYGPKLLAFMGAGQEVLDIGAGYTMTLLGGSITIMYLFLLSAVFRGAGDATIAMKSLWLANGINLVLDPLLIFGIGPFPELGVTGAAVATTIGRGTGVIYQLIALFDGFGRLKMQLSHLRLQIPVLLRLIRLSLGGVLQHMIAVASWIFLMRIVTPFGSAAVAGYALAIRLIDFAFLPAWGFSNAAATLVGQNLGANQADRAEQSVWQSSKYNVIFCVVMSLGYIVFAEPLMMFFTDDSEILRFGINSLRIISLGFGLFALGMVMMQALNGAGDTDTPMLINFVAFWLLQIPIAYVLATQTYLGANGVFWSIAIAESVLALLALAAFKRGRWKLRQI